MVPLMLLIVGFVGWNTHGKRCFWLILPTAKEIIELIPLQLSYERNPLISRQMAVHDISVVGV